MRVALKKKLTKKSGLRVDCGHAQVRATTYLFVKANQRTRVGIYIASKGQVKRMLTSSAPSTSTFIRSILSTARLLIAHETVLISHWTCHAPQEVALNNRAAGRMTH